MISLEASHQNQKISEKKENYDKLYSNYFTDDWLHSLTEFCRKSHAVLEKHY